MKKFKINKITTLHFWHIVNISPWPILLSFNILSMPVGLVAYLQQYFYGFHVFLFSFLSVIFILFFWFFDIVVEATFEGFHTTKVVSNLRIGMLLFIFSEVMFFFAFFWSFFWSSITPTISLNMAWPPVGLNTLIFKPFDIPFLNTMILLLSGTSITLAHLFIKDGIYERAFYALLVTIYLAELFMVYQYIEYVTSKFDISDSVYGSTFFICTGFHGFHVMIGTIFIIFVTIRVALHHNSRLHHFGFEAAAWYWHFVDVVWLFLFITIYYWGSDLVYSDLLGLPEMYFILRKI